MFGDLPRQRFQDRFTVGLRTPARGAEEGGGGDWAVPHPAITADGSAETLAAGSCLEQPIKTSATAAEPTRQRATRSRRDRPLG